MSATERLTAYAEGWTAGDVDTILEAASNSFVFDDPNAGRISRDQFADYFAGLKDEVAALRGEGHASHVGPFMRLTELLAKEDGDGLTASCWWTVPGTDLQGSGLIKVEADGVRSERIAYYTRLPG